MTPTLRRLNDRERYWGLTWPAWLGCGVAGAALYLAIRVSPLGTRVTVTVVLLMSAFAGMVLAGVSGQALSPLRQLGAVVAYRCSPKQYRLTENAYRRGVVVLDHEPELSFAVPNDGENTWH
jgi:glycerol uptake facilitator-like aquaporin